MAGELLAVITMELWEVMLLTIVGFAVVRVFDCIAQWMRSYARRVEWI
jgi:hypothetical protein